MILCDREIESAFQLGWIYCDPRPTPSQYSSTSVDLTLAASIWVWKIPEVASTGDRQKLIPNSSGFDIKALIGNPDWGNYVEIDPQTGYDFDVKGQFLLAYTRERICLPHTSRIAGRVEGKSSLARLGIGIHVTAPTIHAGFGFSSTKPPESTAQAIQLEMFNLSGLPIRLDVGMRICQLILEEVRETPRKGNDGQFNQQPQLTQPKRPKRGK